MKLSEHFTLEEFEYSSTAIAYGINNRCPSTLIPNLCNLCEQVLEPLRRHFETPVIISSGYRCTKLNNLVGGARNSHHLTGRAADIILPLTLNLHPSTLAKWYHWLYDNCQCHELIWEKKGKTRWIHVSI